MPKYDAFGREVGEDTLAGLGGTPETRDEPAPAPRPAPASPEGEAARRELTERLDSALSQVAAARATGSPAPVVVRRSGRGCLGALVVLGVIIAALGGGVALLVGSTSDVADRIEDVTRSIPTPARPSKPPADPRGLGPRSLVRRASFAAALAKLRSRGGGRLTNLRLAPERLDAQLLTPAGRLRSVQLRPGGTLERFGSDSGAGFDSTPTIPLRRLNPGAPQRLARRGAAVLRLPVTDLQYLVPTYSTGTVTWVAYFTRARYVLGDAAGRFQRRYP